MELSKLKIGESGKVVSIKTDLSVKNRLAVMGLTEGVTVTLIRCAPFLDPIEIKLRGFYLALRIKDANKIQVEKF